MADPLALAEKSRRTLRSKTDSIHQSALGQFFTPPAIARFMASLSRLSRKQLRLIDAGAGVGALTAAWVDEICSRVLRPEKIALTAFELDEKLLPALERTLAACQHSCEAAGISCTWEIRTSDFIEMAVESLDVNLFGAAGGRYDVAILNPPYKKINSESRARGLLRRLGIETSNLYAAFVALSTLLLDEAGELIAITPRSFCNGPYFLPFRKLLLSKLSFTRFHVFETRDQAFRDDAVLQENIIFHAFKGLPQQSSVTISHSRTPSDQQVVELAVPFEKVIRTGDPQAFFHLVFDDDGHTVSKFMEALPCTLHELGLSISTGRVVDFRARQWLQMQPSPGSVPLIYSTHFDRGLVRWPKPGSRKPNAIKSTNENTDLFVPAGIYVLVRRFSAKEEPRRVVAAIFDPDHVPCEVVGFENHLNYFHLNGSPLERLLAWGLAAFLNSSLVDAYFRQFNGHTQVNAADLRSLRYPNKNALIAIGRRIKELFPSQEDLDSLIAEIIQVK
jgi:adenine-specific DNA-methyltransferase